MTLINPKRISEETVQDRLYKAFVSHTIDELSESDKAVLKRITEIDAQMRERKPVKKTIKGKEFAFNRPYHFKELVDWIVERFKPISHRQAYADIELTKKFFLSMESREDKEFGRGQHILIGTEFMFEAAAQGDYKSAAAFFKEIGEIRGFKRVDPEVVDREKLTPSDLVLVDKPSELGFEDIEDVDQLAEDLMEEFKKGVKKKILNTAEEINYESEETAE